MNHYFTNNENLKSEIRYINYNIENVSLTFASDNGVFSKNEIDYGSDFLVKTFLKNSHIKKGNFLDLGCGYGFIGLTLKKLLNINITLSDVNKRAVHLAKMNSKSNNLESNIYLSDGFANINDTFDVIITNPPIRVGKEILLKLLNESLTHLKDNGELWFVMRKDQGVKSIMNILEEKHKCDIVDKSKGFYIIKCYQGYKLTESEKYAII